MGSIAKDKWSKALVDKKAFGVRKANDSVDNLKSKFRNDVSKTMSESKKIFRGKYEPNQVKFIS